MWSRELVRFTILLRPHASVLTDRYSERKEAGGPASDAATDLSAIATAHQRMAHQQVQILDAATTETLNN